MRFISIDNPEEFWEVDDDDYRVMLAEEQKSAEHFEIALEEERKLRKHICRRGI